MRVLSYDPEDNFFFVDMTWDEYRRLAAEYEIDTKGADAEEVIEIQKDYRRELAEEVFDASYPFQQYLKDLYGIDNMPEVCLVVKRDLSDLWVDQYDHPFHHLWNGESPWIKIRPVPIEALTDLAGLEPAAAGDGAYEDEPDLVKPEREKRGEDSGMEKKTTYNIQWAREQLTSQALGKFCEYYAKMALLSYGVRIYTPEIDDHGIDFVAEGRKGFLKFQVKGVRGLSQVFMEKEKFDVEDDAMFLILLLLVDGEEPDMYVIPASAWRRESPVFVSHDYSGKKSRPDYTVNVSKKNLPELEQYRLENMLSIF
ncbi:hypothetical protein [Oscillibacter sp.]|uniref:hypothetical protein n=1 Tax=Oscillibacter sp. TaxID=1945593 RepID=UPI002D7EED6D|nr:hypothetical protein [Oscillibacter sp.]